MLKHLTQQWTTYQNQGLLLLVLPVPPLHMLSWLLTLWVPPYCFMSMSDCGGKFVEYETKASRKY